MPQIQYFVISSLQNCWADWNQITCEAPFGMENES